MNATDPLKISQLSDNYYSGTYKSVSRYLERPTFQISSTHFKLHFNPDQKPISKSKLIRRFVDFTYFSTLIHELGHAIAYKAFSKKKCNIIVNPNGDGRTSCDARFSKVQDTIISASGTIATFLFINAALLGLRQMDTDTLWKHALCNYSIQCLSEALHDETFYSITSAIGGYPTGDFTSIAKKSKTHLIAATACLGTLYSSSLALTASISPHLLGWHVISAVSNYDNWSALIHKPKMRNRSLKHRTALLTYLLFLALAIFMFQELKK
jgi:hypothetical protein